MKNYSVKKLVLSGIMIALVFLATYFTRIPTPLPGGYFNLGDAAIMLAAVFLGPVGGLVAGAIGSSIADLAAGALLFAPITLVVKGLEGLIVGLFAAKYRQQKAREQQAFATRKTTEIQQSTENKQTGSQQAVIVSLNYHLAGTVAVGAVIMAAGYFAAEAFLLGFFDEAFGWTAAVTELLPNFIQGGLSAILGYILIVLLSKMNIEKYIC